MYIFVDFLSFILCDYIILGLNVQNKWIFVCYFEQIERNLERKCIAMANDYHAKKEVLST